MRDFTETEIGQIRMVLNELVRAEKRDDILGRFSQRQMAWISIPLLMWAQGHDLD